MEIVILIDVQYSQKAVFLSLKKVETSKSLPSSAPGEKIPPAKYLIRLPPGVGICSPPLATIWKTL